jgi:hypothetical protein
MTIINKTGLLCFLLITLTLYGTAKKSRPKNAPIKKYVIEGFSKPQQSDSSIPFLRSFFKWYKTKYDYLDHHIFPVATDYKNNTPYRIDFKATEKYLLILKSSGFFSDSFIRGYRNHFKQIDSTFQKTKQNDGPVDGLDYDPIVHSQEPEAMLEDLASIKLEVIKFTTNSFTIKMRTKYNVKTYLLYYLKKTGDKYSIDKIDFLIDGVVQKP